MFARTLRGLLVGAILAGAPSRSSAAPPTRTAEDVRDAYRAAVSTLPCIKEQDDDIDTPNIHEPEVVAALSQAWTLIMEWTVRYLDAHPDADEESLEKSLRGLSPSFDCPTHWWSLGGQVLKLGGGEEAAYVIAAGYPQVGTLFLVARNAGREFRVVWSVPDPIARGDEDDPPKPWGGGSLRHSLDSLPPAATGHARFRVLSTGFQPHGCCGGQHLGFWEWTGREMRPLLWKSYAFARCDDAPGRADGENIELDGSLLTVAMRGTLHTWSGTCSDPRPRAVWKVEITPEGILDLGEDWEEPDLRFVDQVLDAVLRRQDASELIAPEAAKELDAALSPKAHTMKSGRKFLGMADFSTAEARGAKRLVSEGSDWSACFFIVERNGRPFVKSVEVRFGNR